MGTARYSIYFGHANDSFLQIDDAVELTYTSAVKDNLAICFAGE